MYAPANSFIQFAPYYVNSGCDMLLPVNSVSDVSFFVEYAGPFREGIYIPKTNTYVYDTFIYNDDSDLGAWVDLFLPGGDLSVYLECGDCFSIVLRRIATDVFFGYSQPLQYECDTQYTSIIEYKLDESGFGWNCPTGWNKIRLPIELIDPQYPQESEVYKRRNGTRKVLFASVGKSYVLTTDYFPPILHQRLTVALSHDDVRINGEKVTKTDNYEIDWGEKMRLNCFDAAPAEAEVTVDEQWLNSNCGECVNVIKGCIGTWSEFICRFCGYSIV